MLVLASIATPSQSTPSLLYLLRRITRMKLLCRQQKHSQLHFCTHSLSWWGGNKTSVGPATGSPPLPFLRRLGRPSPPFSPPSYLAWSPPKIAVEFQRNVAWNCAIKMPAMSCLNEFQKVCASPLSEPHFTNNEREPISSNETV